MILLSAEVVVVVHFLAAVLVVMDKKNRHRDQVPDTLGNAIFHSELFQCEGPYSPYASLSRSGKSSRVPRMERTNLCRSNHKIVFAPIAR
jgi:hypothetical protein